MIVHAVVGWMACAILLLFLIAVFIADKTKIDNLEKRNRNLIEQNSKLLDQIRIKGATVNRLTRQIKRLEKEENREVISRRAIKNLKN